ncbi:MAG: sigma 54-interacting transcriptional regulator, partial [Planctomycetota bacterium]|nr:sigma 54-interacting transcriptional regulator [Planctomycetota bacterium]
RLLLQLYASQSGLAETGAAGASLRRSLGARIPALAPARGNGSVVLPEVGPEGYAYLAVAAHIGGEDDARGAWLALGERRSGIETLLRDQREPLLWMALLGVLLVTGVATLIARRVADPVRQLVEVTDAVRQGRFDVEVPLAGEDEVGQLTVAFDQMRRDLRHRLEDLDFLRGAQERLASSLDFGRRADIVLALFTDRFTPSRALLLDARSERGPVAVIAESGDTRRFPERDFVPVADGFVRQALAARAVMDLDAAASDATEGMAARLLEGAAAWLAIPLRAGDEVQGLALLGWEDAAELPSAEGRRLLEPLAGITASSLHNARLYRLAALDDVTRLPGATAFEAALRADVERAVAGGPEAVLLRIGLDHLEHVTMRRDVQLARELLRSCAEALLAVVGERLHLGRLREEELGVRLPGASPEQVRQIAESIRARLATVEIPGAEGGDVAGTTASIGVARCPANARSLEFLLDAAGRALAAAQREGGDHVEDAARLGSRAVGGPPFEEGAIFRNEAMVMVVESARRAARSEASVLITGETGTGKEVIASLIHRRSARAKRPFVTVNCAAFPESLLESELFGHERGAFTGAEHRREGRFELADGGTLFLDEIAEMTLSAQVKLLRVLQERQFTRLGGTRTIDVDVRIIAATNRDLEAAVADGSLREDLYYRLNVIRLELPPLRERREEIPPLVDLFLREAAARAGRGPKGLTTAAMDVLYRHPWPGNVRELKNVIERCTVLCEAEQVGPEHLQLDGGSTPDSGGFLAPRSAPRDDLNDRQRRLLDYLARHGRCTNREYQELTGTSPRTGLRDLQDLMQRGLVMREGKRRGAVYRLP